MQKMLEALYQERIHDFSQKVSFFERRSKYISIVRLLVFLVSFVLVYYFASNESTQGIFLSLAGGVVAFIILIKWHSRALEQKRIHIALREVNENELAACQGNYGKFPDGAEFGIPDHPFSNDLDLFGRNSLYQYLNRTATVAGQKKLARSLMRPIMDKQAIIDMQVAIGAMAENLEWRQKFQAIGLAYEEGPDDQLKIENWSASKPLFNAWIFRILVLLIPLMTLTMIYFLSIGAINIQVFLVYLVLPWGLAGSFAMRVNQRHNNVSKTTEMLKKYALLLHEIETLDVSSGILESLKNNILRGKDSAGKSLRSLSAIMTALDNRLNFVSWALLNGLLLWDILQMIRLEAWQMKYRVEMKDWFEVVALMDVINSFANFRHNQTNSIFPEVVDDVFMVDAKEAGHPLINAESRVNNEINLREGEFLIVTGANMAGKSTYLRMIGVNLVLAMCGSPVCASTFRFAPVQVFTSIRTRDSLSENESYFYAELKRLKAIIDELRNGTKLFILLDEILKGTNSKDKHAGSEALLQQMIYFKTTGIVATHDVLLGKLSDKFPEHIRNHCFEVDIDGDQLHFDYRLKDGISKNLNATILMREMGITI